MKHKVMSADGIERIAAERKRQIEKEGFTAEYDDQWTDGELALAAACYALEPDRREEKPKQVY